MDDAMPDDTPDGTPRCLTCGYQLAGLAEPRCPECGRPFDPAKPTTFTALPPFLFWAYWLPGVGLATVAGLAVLAVFTAYGALGWGFTIGGPAMVGCLLGYGVRAKYVTVAAATLPVLGAILVVLVSQKIEGTFCGCIMGGIAIVPLGVGAGVGTALRQALKRTRFGQRWHLPSVLLMLLLPAALDAAERAWGGSVASVAQSTAAVLPVDVSRAWHARLFAEPTPSATDGPFRFGMVQPNGSGGSTAVGRTFVGRFTGGATAVRITRRDEPRELAWAFVSQAHVEDRAVRLLDGRMTFEPVGPSATRVTVTTRYQPLMTPRWCWRPVEWWAGDATHRRLLAAMVPPP